MAEKVKKIGSSLGLHTEIEFFKNPRVEDEQDHYYNPIHEKMYQFGFRAEHNLEEELEIMLTDLSKYKRRIAAKKERICPRCAGEKTALVVSGGWMKMEPSI